MKITSKLGIVNKTQLTSPWHINVWYFKIVWGYKWLWRRVKSVYNITLFTVVWKTDHAPKRSIILGSVWSYILCMKFNRMEEKILEIQSWMRKQLGLLKQVKVTKGQLWLHDHMPHVCMKFQHSRAIKVWEQM